MTIRPALLLINAHQAMLAANSCAFQPMGPTFVTANQVTLCQAIIAQILMSVLLMEDRDHVVKSVQILLDHFHVAANLVTHKMDITVLTQTNVLQMEEEDHVAKCVPTLLVHFFAAASLVTVSQATVVLMLMNVCKMED